MNAHSGVALDVASHETILSCLKEKNIDAAFSCEQGACGTCVIRVIEVGNKEAQKTDVPVCLQGCR